MSEQNPAPGALAWRRMDTDPDCDEVRIEVAWGAWPYRITAYRDTATVQRYVPGSPVRVHTISRGSRSFDAMMAEARLTAESWDTGIQREIVAAGLAAAR